MKKNPKKKRGRRGDIEVEGGGINLGKENKGGGREGEREKERDWCSRLVDYSSRDIALVSELSFHHHQKKLFRMRHRRNYSFLLLYLPY